MQNSRSIFNHQAIEAHKYYPNLSIKGVVSNLYLQGTIDLQTEGGDDIATYFIRITYSENFPYSFPKLYEIGGDIPRDVNWHKYSDDSCCVTAPLVERLACVNGITILQFIRDYVVPYLSNQYHRKKFGCYKDEYAHGLKGVRQSYVDIMRTDNIELWAEYIDYAIYRTSPTIGRNSLCSCGSGRKYKYCHQLVLADLKKLNESELLTIKRSMYL